MFVRTLLSVCFSSKQWQGTYFKILILHYQKRHRSVYAAFFPLAKVRLQIGCGVTLRFILSLLAGHSWILSIKSCNSALPLLCQL
ncbi:hypothetical protein J4727_00085 [Providencia rettgeri]|uniref:Uncharacterized protein n=1 Tax=Providencia rettgeri TaxID=587 RepID=A0A939NBA7_PRORE|nr:hypothetical protein [Providencia rettgeri]